MSDASQRLRALIAQHCVTLRLEAADIGAALECWPDDEVPDSALLHRALAAAHKLKGSSGTIGFASISTRAATLEGLLEQTAEAPDAGRRDHILRLNRELQAEVSRLTPEQSSLFNRRI